MISKFTFYVTAVLLLVFINTLALAQNTTLSGTVVDQASQETLPGVSVTIKGTTAGTSTDGKGMFTLVVKQSLPFTLVVTYIGYKTVEQTITGPASDIRISLEAQSVLGQEVVVAATRAPQSILESPVSIERLGVTAIRETPAANFYDALTNLKGVELSTQSFTFKSVNTRGFNANGNVRFNQLIDGMDNQAPGLNFAVGNVVGISEIDLESAELLPGASSALYGAGGTNGTLLLTSKDPFQYQGLSVQFKTGANHVDEQQRGLSNWQDMQLRYAKAWNNKFAFKANISYLQANDWQGQDYSNFDRFNQTSKTGDRQTDPNYDGVNSYGDEINANMRDVAQAVLLQGRAAFTSQYQAATGMAPSEAQVQGFLSANPQTRPFFLGTAAGIIPNQAVSRTGYIESNLVNFGSRSLKTSGSINYKITNDIQALAQAYWGSGTSVYTGADRYSLSNFNLGQYKLELKGKNFFLRGYTTQERSGEAYNATALASLLNEAFKPSATWFPQYVGNYVGAVSAGANDAQAHVAARAASDQGRFVPGSVQFETAKSSIISRTIGPAGGAKFNDKSNMYHYEGMYNFSSALKFAEFLVGGSYRIYDLNSDGTIFDDLNKDLSIKEYGAYAQLGKRMFNEKFKLTGSIRYDKNENFEGRFTPRVAGVITIAENNNIRLSYQTGFRNPTTQNQYIDLLVRAGSRLIGALPSVIDKYNLRNNRPYTNDSYQAFVAAGRNNPALLQEYTFQEFKPEKVEAYEIGYKGLLSNKLLFDTYYYYNRYNDFITGIILFQNQTPDNPAGLAAPARFETVVNNPETVTAQGWAAGLDYNPGRFNFNGNVSYNKLSDIPGEFFNDYNTPEYRFVLGAGSRELVKNFGFNVAYRWQDKFTWRSSFITGEVPAFGTLDAQVSIKIPTYKSTLKIGGSNLLNKYYKTSFGNPQVGGLYYVSLLFDQFLR